MANKYFYLNTSREKMNYFQKDWNSVYGTIPKVKGVVLHDSASGMNATAESVAKYTIKNMNNANYHNVVDSKGNCYAIVDMKKCAYHLGSEYGNKNFIGIEIAESLTGGSLSSTDKTKYLKAWHEGCKLVADYLVYYNLDTDVIFQHNEFSSTACPYTMKLAFGSYAKALAETKKQVKIYMGQIKGVSAPQKVYFGKVKADLRNTRFGKNKNPEYLIEFITTAGVYVNKELTKKDTSADFKKGQVQASRVVGQVGKYWVHSFISDNGKTYYFAYMINK